MKGNGSFKLHISLKCVKIPTGDQVENLIVKCEGTVKDFHVHYRASSQSRIFPTESVNQVMEIKLKRIVVKVFD